MSERDCKHGHLARSCELCEMLEQIATLQAEIEQLRAKAADAYEALLPVAECLCMGGACEKDFLKGFEAVQLIGKEAALARERKGA